MSISTVRSIHCDCCGRWTYGSDPLDSPARVRAFARRSGWKVGSPGGDDVCPPCQGVTGSTVCRGGTWQHGQGHHSGSWWGGGVCTFCGADRREGVTK